MSESPSGDLGAVGSHWWATRHDWFGGPRYVRRSLVLFALLGSAIAACWIAIYGSGVPLPDLTQDPAVVAADRWYIGAVSILGVAVWMSGSAIAATVSRFAASASSRLALAWFGSLGIILAIDDALLLHEDVLSQHLGTTVEKVVYLAYAVAVTTGLYRARREIFEPGSLLFVASLVCLGASICCDVLELRNELEDGLKVVGIVCWSAGLIERSLAELRRLRDPVRGDRSSPITDDVRSHLRDDVAGVTVDPKGLPR